MFRRKPTAQPKSKPEPIPVDESTKPEPPSPRGSYKVWQLPDGHWGMEVWGNRGGYWWWDDRRGEWRLDSGYVYGGEVARHEFHDTEDEARTAALAAWDAFLNQAAGALNEAHAQTIMLS